MRELTSSPAFTMSSSDCEPLGGIDDLATAVVSLPTFLAFCTIFLATIQGVIPLESSDPCRLSTRKMNMLLLFEMLEIIVSITSEVLSFLELRSALQIRLQHLHWIAPCLLAAGCIEILINTYFTMAVVTKSRVGWMPFSSSGSSNHWWEIFPFSITAAFSIALVGWRLRWWWKGCVGPENVVLPALSGEPALRRGVLGFAVGWALGVTALVLFILILADCADDGAHYLFSIPYLWKPDQWISHQEHDIKVWYRKVDPQTAIQQYVATAVLDASVPLPENERDVFINLSKEPLRCGNSIVGTDRDEVENEDKGSSRLHKVMLIAEHAVILPLLIVVAVIISRLHEMLDRESFNVIRQLTDAVVIIAFFEIAIGLKNILWSFSGTNHKDRGTVSQISRLQRLNTFYMRYLEGRDK